MSRKDSRALQTQVFGGCVEVLVNFLLGYLVVVSRETTDSQNYFFVVRFA